MFVRIIPYTKTLRGVNWFDYQLPDDINLVPGTTVWVEFRHTVLAGLVWEIIPTTTAQRIKPIQAALSPDQQYWQAPERLKLLAWFAQYYGVSLPTAWKTLQWPYLKRAVKDVSSTPVVGNAHVRSLRRKAPPPTLVLWNRPADVIDYYKKIIAAATAPILIIVPEYQRASELKQLLDVGTGRDLSLHEVMEKEPSPTRLHHLQHQLTVSGEPRVIIGTKRLLGLNLKNVGTVIVDQADSHSHKQFDANPRYHVHTVVEQLGTLYPELHVVFASSCPPLRLAQQVRDKQLAIDDIRQPWTHPVDIVDMNHASHPDTSRWLSEPLLDALKKSTHSFLFLNRTGEFRISQCRDCQQLNPVGSSTCQACQSVNLKQLRYGTQTIETELRRLFPDKIILRIDQQQTELTLAAVAQAQIIIGTEKALRWIDLGTVDLIGVVSVDHLLVYPHFQAHERVWQLLTTLLVAGRPTLIQTWSPSNTVISTACRNRYWEFAKPELDLRAQLQLPPFGDSIRLLDHRTGVTTLLRGSVDIDTLEPSILIDRVE